MLAGSVDVLVCDSLTGNAIVKLLAAFTTGGRMEVAGSGYGPGVGEGPRRSASSPGATRRARRGERPAADGKDGARRPRRDLRARERAAAEAAGLAGLLGGRTRHPAAPRPASRRPPAGSPARKTVHHEIGGIDVLEIEPAIALLAPKGIYAEPAMGCTGPVVLVAPEDAARGRIRLREAQLL